MLLTCANFLAICSSINFSSIKYLIYNLLSIGCCKYLKLIYSKCLLIVYFIGEIKIKDILYENMSGKTILIIEINKILQ